MAKSHIRMMHQKGTQQRGTRPPSAQGTRERLLAELPVTERRLKLNGVSTAVLEGGVGKFWFCEVWTVASPAARPPLT